MTISGVGPVVALAYTAPIDIPQRFRNSKTVGSILGLAPALNQSGESHRAGRVSLCDDGMMRPLLYEAAQVMLTRVKKWSWLKAWAMNVAKRCGLSDRRTRPSAGSHHAPHVGGRHRIPLDAAGGPTRRRLTGKAAKERDKVPPTGGSTSFAGRWMRRVR
ncbi:Transposase IS116/IS110/IS902 family protein [Mesorhizobium muleiense]|uniref:Transposase IS116/IS110/IS902 family protein n=1 Tax=Mesorhizobium muleiense TaxID=1004279 RepID=A0A1G9L0P3_9HYPH|nr:Transposase IS116/IS110/IS902 family protein [Mesorhizobium muleiense]